MRLLISAVVLTLSLCNSAIAELSLRIIDSPEKVWIYAPVYITAELKNEGKERVLVAVNDNSSNGWFFEIISPEGRRRYWDGWNIDRFADPVVWINPGESYFFQTDISYGSENLKAGTFQVQAMVSGSSCRLPPEHLRAPEFRSAPNICWRGEVRSQEVTVIVTPPDLEREQQILDGILASKYCEHPCDWFPFAHSYQTLKKLFPGNYYTFVAAFHAARGWIGGTTFTLMNDALQLQPHHPLSIYAEMDRALGTIFQSNDPNFEERSRLILVEELPVPPALRRFIEFKQRENEKQIASRRIQLKEQAKCLWE